MSTIKTPPLVSVVIPAYNAATYLEQTLKSVLAQTYAHLEVLVVNDGSTDSTLAIMQRFAQQDNRVVVLQQANAGVAAARNLAIQQAQGDFIAPIDADDIWYPEKLEKQVNFFLQSSERVGLVYAWSVLLNEAGQQLPFCQTGSFEGNVLIPLIFSCFPGNASSPLIRRSCLEQVGGYDPGYRAQQAQGCEDWDLYLRIAERYEFRVVPELLVGYRQVQGSMSFNPAPMMKACEMILANVAQRHPEIPAELFRWSLASFHWYIALKCWRSSDYPGTLRHLSQIVQQDKLHLLNVGFYRVSLSTITHLLLKPVTRFWQPSQVDLNQRWEKYAVPDQETELATLQQQKEQEKQPFRRKYFYWLLDRRINSFQQRQFRSTLVPEALLKS